MGTTSKTDMQGFGVKGIAERATSLADSLLTGRPLSRPVKDTTPKLKPRPKPVFGRKCETLEDRRAYNASNAWGRRFAAVLVVGFVGAMCANLLFLP